MIKKIFCTLFIITIFLSGCGSKNDDLDVILKRGKLIAGVRSDVKPFGYRDINGTLQGYDIELAKILAKSLLQNSEAVEFVPVTAENRVEKLNSGEVDLLVATMSITKQRLLVVDFSEPYYAAGQALLVKNLKNINSLRNLNGKNVIIVFGSTGEENIKMNVPEAKVIGFKTYPEALNALLRGEGDALIADDTVLLNFALNNKSVKLMPQRYSKEPYAIAFRQGKKSERLKKRVNHTLINLKNMGILKNLEQKWGIKHG